MVLEVLIVSVVLFDNKACWGESEILNSNPAATRTCCRKENNDRRNT